MNGEVPKTRRVLLLGATGTIGLATLRALLDRGNEVVCFLRESSRAGTRSAADRVAPAFAGATLRFGDLTDPSSWARDCFRGERFDAVISCLASRTGAPKDAWAIDYGAHRQALHASRAAGVTLFVLLSAICVQKPLLAFQHAKLAFERELMGSGLDYVIVRPTAFFKSLSGQIDRVRKGKPFLVFGDGTLTSCKPISDRDLAAFLVESIDNPERRNRILPIGGPGEPITPKQQGECLFRLMGRPAKYRQVPVALLEVIVAVTGLMARFVPSLAAKAEYARIGRYYATESMLVFDGKTGKYDAGATPSTGSDTLFEHYARRMSEGAGPEA